MSAWPLTLRVPKTRDALVIEWDDGSQDRLVAALLRERCPSARAKRDRLDASPDITPDIAPSIAPSLTIETIDPIGQYAVNIAFSDGHGRGIFPFSFLHALAGEARLEREKFETNAIN